MSDATSLEQWWDPAYLQASTRKFRNRRLAALTERFDELSVHELAAARVLMRSFELERPNNYLNSQRPWQHFGKYAASAPERFSAEGLTGRRVLEFGSGTRNAVSLGLLLLLNGAREVVCYEPGPINGPQSGVAAEQLLVDSLRQPAAFAASGRDPGEVRKVAIDLLTSEIPGPIVMQARKELEQLPANDFDMCMSNHVFEHVGDVPYELALLRRLVADHGVQLHRVDFRDHRTFGGGSARAFEFYTDGELTTCNGLRPSDFRALLEEYVVEERTVSRLDEGEVADQRHARFADYPVDELRISGIDYLLQTADA